MPRSSAPVMRGRRRTHRHPGTRLLRRSVHAGPVRITHPQHGLTGDQPQQHRLAAALPQQVAQAAGCWSASPLNFFHRRLGLPAPAPVPVRHRRDLFNRAGQHRKVRVLVVLDAHSEVQPRNRPCCSFIGVPNRTAVGERLTSVGGLPETEYRPVTAAV